MGLLDQLLRRTPRATDPAPPIRTTRPAIPISGEDEPSIESAVRFILEPYFAMIEYRDAALALTQRRVTMRSVIDRDGTRYLQAFCHERNALRTFRLDRIICIINQDGEVEDAAAWFAEILPISETEAVTDRRGNTGGRERSPPAVQVSPYTALRREITPALTVLIAAARSDDFLHPKEVDRILRFAEDEAVFLREAGLLPGNPEAEAFDKLERTIRRLRPTREDVESALDSLLSLDLPRKKHLVHALAETAAADGNIDDIEAELIEDFRQMGARRHGMGWDG